MKFRYKNLLIGGLLVGFFFALAVFSKWLSPYSYSEIVTQDLKLPPSFIGGGSNQFLFGTDDLGRDVLSRLLVGSSFSFGIGLAVVFFSVGIGTFLGILSGYFRGWLDEVLSRGVDILLSLPSLLLGLAVVTVLGPSLLNTVVAISFVSIPSCFRLIRSAVMEQKVRDYVVAAQALGAGPTRIIVKHIMPNIFPMILIQCVFGFSDGILNAAALGFLGLGVQAPYPEWGTMLSDSKAMLETSPHLVILPGLCILLLVLGFNLLGDGLRDKYDPKMR